MKDKPNKMTRKEYLNKIPKGEVLSEEDAYADIFQAIADMIEVLDKKDKEENKQIDKALLKSLDGDESIHVDDEYWKTKFDNIKE